jgi:outer membrane receptor protein involved in Fe transport
MSSWGKIAGFLIPALLLADPFLFAQTSFGGVNGTVSDPSGAVVAEATVTLVNRATNIEARTRTNSAGYFTFVNVRPGDYTLTVERAGFKLVQVPVFNVGVGQTVTQNVTLEVGAVTQTVEVMAQATLLQPSSSELGHVVQAEVVHNLPLNGRNFTQLILLSPGVNPVSVAQGPTATMTFQSEGNTGIPGSTIANASIQGQQNRSKIFFYDGIINTSVRGTSYVVLPDIDMIEEFKVQSHNDKAEYGGVTGGVVNMYSKSGTNAFHGSAFEFVRNDAFVGRNPFTDSDPVRDACDRNDGRLCADPFRQNQFGANIGGPIMRNKTFFHAGYDGWRYRDVAAGFNRIPEAAELGGDFSNYFWNRDIYNPYSTRLDANGNLIRDRFMCDAGGSPLTPLADGTQPAGTPCNIIPPSLISPLMLGFFQTYAVQPNLAGDPQNNFQQTRSRESNANNYQVRVDHHFSERDNVFFRWNEQRIKNRQPVGDRAANSPDFKNRNFGGGWLHTFSPSVILEVRGGAATQPSEDAPARHELGTEPLKALGFADIDRFDGLIVNIAAGNPWSTRGGGISNNLGHRGPAPRGNPNYSLTGNLTWLRGNHNFKTGFQWVRIDREQINQFQQLDFNELATADPQSAGTGDSLASALLGFPSRFTGQLSEVARIEFWTATWSGFFQDEWKARPNLTLTMGLRYDYVDRTHGKGDVMLQSGPDVDNGLWLIARESEPPPCAQAQRAPCIPADSLADVPFGEFIRVTGERDNFLKPIKDNFGPRVGVAWQVNNNTVVRGGYSLMWDALPSRSQYGQHQYEFWGWPQSGGFDTGTVNQIGAPLQTVEDLQGTFPFVLPPASPWNARGWFNDPDRKDSYSHQWHVEIQRQMTQSLMMAVAYVGSKSGRLEYAGGANTALTPGGGTPDEINARRPVPYLSAEGIYSRDIGEANYHSLQYKLQRRFASGLAALISYTWQKSIDTSSGWFSAENGVGGQTIQNYHDPKSNRAVSSYDVPHLFTAGVVWDIPVGRGKTYLNSGPASWILGGWQINTLLLARSGQPFTPDVGGDIAGIGARSGYNYGRPNLIGNPKLANPTRDQWFDGNAFEVPVLSYGNAGRNILRVDGVFNTDFSLFKTIPFGETRTLQLRFESFNVFNQMDLGNPATRIDQSSPGRITSISHSPRQMQFGLRFVF